MLHLVMLLQQKLETHRISMKVLFNMRMFAYFTEVAHVNHSIILIVTRKNAIQITQEKRTF